MTTPAHFRACFRAHFRAPFRAPSRASFPGLLLLLAACAAPPPLAPPVEPPAPVVAAPPPAPVAPPPAPVPGVAQPEPLASPQDVQKALASALDYLQAGQEDPAEAELKRVLATEPGNRLALSLMRQIRDDPQVLLGRESFSYKVQPGESLSRLSQRFLNDLHLFYALARYNNIKVPRTLAGGATIRVPGKAPLAAAPQAPPPAVAPVVTPSPPAVSAEAEAARALKQKNDTITRHTRSARAAFAKQDLDGALRGWDAVLALDPENRTALLERQKTQSLKEKLGQVK